MIRFLLNDTFVESASPSGSVALDLIRYEQALPGTKIGCREGDCGACTVLVGELRDGRLEYRAMTSCLLALASLHGKHVVTVEGLTMPGLSPVQRAMVDANGTQCGFCTPGFVVSLSGCCLSREPVDARTAVRAIDGNICRCTGYHSIIRAAHQVADPLSRKDLADPLAWSVAQGFLPRWFLTVADRLRTIPPTVAPSSGVVLAGGTDLYVQKHDAMAGGSLRAVADDPALRGIRQEGEDCVVGAAAVVTDLLESPLLRAHFPRLEQHLLLVSSTPIRNMGTVAGNFINASPIGDLTAIFLALGGVLTLRARDGGARSLPLEQLYLGYKQLALQHGEMVESVRFRLPGPGTHFGFEKVSKRTYLDIASVNTAASIELDGGTITAARVSAGGVAPVPLLLKRAGAALVGQPLTHATLRAATDAAQLEIAPISDARGSATYKRVLLRQLLRAHFLGLFPEHFSLEQMT